MPRVPSVTRNSLLQVRSHTREREKYQTFFAHVRGAAYNLATLGLQKTVNAPFSIDTRFFFLLLLLLLLLLHHKNEDFSIEARPEEGGEGGRRREEKAKE